MLYNYIIRYVHPEFYVHHSASIYGMNDFIQLQSLKVHTLKNIPTCIYIFLKVYAHCPS